MSNLNDLIIGLGFLYIILYPILLIAIFIVVNYYEVPLEDRKGLYPFVKEEVKKMWENM